MRTPLLVQYYRDLPDRGAEDTPRQAARRIHRGLNKFRKAVEARYTEGTLIRLLNWYDPEVRQATVLALGLMGSVRVNPLLAGRLRDEDPGVCDLAADALWSLWFRADTPENNQELQRLIQLPVRRETASTLLEDYRALLEKAPRFAEAFNQRAIVYFRLGDWVKSAADCEKTLKLNPHHFGAASGLAQCFLKQKKYRAALRSYRRSLRIHPRLEGIREMIASLEKMLGEKGQ